MSEKEKTAEAVKWDVELQKYLDDANSRFQLTEDIYELTVWPPVWEGIYEWFMYNMNKLPMLGVCDGKICVEAWVTVCEDEEAYLKMDEKAKKEASETAATIYWKKELYEYLGELNRFMRYFEEGYGECWGDPWWERIYHGFNRTANKMLITGPGIRGGVSIEVTSRPWGSGREREIVENPIDPSDTFESLLQIAKQRGYACDSYKRDSEAYARMAPLIQKTRQKAYHRQAALRANCAIGGADCHDIRFDTWGWNEYHFTWGPPLYFDTRWVEEKLNKFEENLNNWDEKVKTHCPGCPNNIDMLKAVQEQDCEKQDDPKKRINFLSQPDVDAVLKDV